MAKYLLQNFHCVNNFNIFPDTTHLEFIALKVILDVYVSIILCKKKTIKNEDKSFIYV